MTVDAILEAAEQVIEREGGAALTTNRVAEVAGVSIGTLYQYFPNKEALVGELLERNAVMFRQAAATAIASRAQASVPEIVGAIIEEVLRANATQRPIHHQLFELRRMPEVHARLERSLDLLTELVAAFLRARPDLGVTDPATTAFVLVRAVDGVVVALGDRYTELEPMTIIAELARMITRYI